MRIELHTICWNEVDFLPFFFRHYDPLVDRYFIHDDGSTDGTLDLLAAHPKVEIRRFARPVGDSFVLSHRVFHETAWKESRGRADWVIVTAVDEFLSMRAGLTKKRLATYARAGATMIPAIGYQMISETFPAPGTDLRRTVTTGASNPLMNKLSLFDPNAIETTGYAIGRHEASPQGRLILAPFDELELRHFRYLDFERTLRRNLALADRLGETDRRWGWGSSYNHAEDLRQRWSRFNAEAVDLAAPDFAVWRHGPAEYRWWRPRGFRDPGPPDA